MLLMTDGLLPGLAATSRCRSPARFLLAEGRGRRHQGSVSFPRDISFQASRRLALAFPFGNAFLYVFGGSRVAAHPVYDDAVQRMVGLKVSAPVEPMPDRLAVVRQTLV